MVKYTKKLCKISREKQQATYWEKSSLNDSKLLIRNHGSQKEVVQYFSSAERKINVNSET